MHAVSAIYLCAMVLVYNKNNKNNNNNNNATYAVTSKCTYNVL